ncbi:MAG: hypothetical protein AAGA70_07880 [Pseudomonadota bacterium]
MFDGDQKTFLILGAAVIGFVMITADEVRPREEVNLAVDVSALPPLPAVPQQLHAPRQTDIPDRTLDLPGGFEATLLHGYVLEGRVVTRREYRHDPTSDISPLDLGIVWGSLSDRTEEFEFRNGQRAVFYTPLPGIELPVDWEQQITNNHLIPATPEIDSALMAVELGQRIRVSGYLVEVNAEGLATWRSSTRRDDNTIIGGCEIILVSNIEIIDESVAM